MAEGRGRFENLSVGDLVVIAPQRMGRGYRSSSSFDAYLTPVLKIGRKYGHVNHRGVMSPFCLYSGESHHFDRIARMNGWGFDVFESREEYDRHVKRIAVEDDFKDVVSWLWNGVDWIAKRLSAEDMQTIMRMVHQAKIGDQDGRQ